MANAARAQGVKYICGDAGYVKQLIFGSEGKCEGVVTADGTVYEADIVVLSTGANTATLVDAKEEVVAQTSVICVMKLEPHEIEKYKDIPIIDDFEQGKQVLEAPEERVVCTLTTASSHHISSR